MDEINEWQEYVHYSVIEAALEQYLDGEIQGSIVSIQYPSDEHSQVRVNWAKATTNE